MVRFNSLVKGKLGWLSNNKTNIDAKWSENILKNLKAGYVFSSNGIADFKLAKAIMVKHGLEKEVSFQKIFSMRKNENNLLMSRNISLNLTQELDSRIKIATDFSGKIPVGSLKIIGIKAEIDVIKKSCHQIVTKTEVVF